MLSLAAVIPVTGWASRRFGAKRVFLISLILFTLGSLLCGLATSDTELILFRVLQGIGGGMIMPLAQIIMADAAGPKRMGRVMGLVAVPMMLAPTLGPLLGGTIIQVLNWHWIFFVNLIVGAIAIPLAIRLLPAKTGAKTDTLDFLGLVLMSTGLVAITYGLAEAGTYDSFSNRTSGCRSLLGVVLVIAFVFHALRVKHPLLDLRLYRNWHFSAASIVMFALGAAVFGAMILMPLYWQDLRGYRRDRDRPADRPAGSRHGDHDAAGREVDRALRRRPGGTCRRRGDRGDDDPVRADRRPHQRRLPLRHRWSSAARAWARASCRR